MTDSTARRTSLSGPIPGSYEYLLAQAWELAAKEQPEEALAIAERVHARILRLPEHRRAPYSELFHHLIDSGAAMAALKYRLGDTAAAEEIWSDLAKRDVDRSAFWRRKPILKLIDRGMTEQGLAELRALTEEYPESFENWIGVARIAFDLGDDQLTEECLDNATQFMDISADDDEDIGAYYMLRCSLHMDRGQWREAVDDWFEALNFAPNESRITEWLVRQLLEDQEYDLALKVLDEEGLPEPLIQHYEAWIAYHRGDFVRARNMWRRISEIEVEGPTQAGLKATALCWLGRPLEAIRVILELANATHSLPTNHAAVLGLAWAMQGRLDSARADLHLAINTEDGPTRLSALEWSDFDTLVKDPAIKEELREFFVVGLPQSAPAGEP